MNKPGQSGLFAFMGGMYGGFGHKPDVEGLERLLGKFQNGGSPGMGQRGFVSQC